jgi:hypothetical protein
VEVGLQKKIRHIIFKYTINCMISNLVCDKSCQHLINSLVRDLFKNYGAFFFKYRANQQRVPQPWQRSSCSNLQQNWNHNEPNMADAKN